VSSFGDFFGLATRKELIVIINNSIILAILHVRWFDINNIPKIVASFGGIKIFVPHLSFRQSYYWFLSQTTLFKRDIDFIRYW